jgi:dTDP-4-dehydrorhamnose reductase
MRWLVTGAGGMLGRDLCDVLGRAGETGVVAATRADLDVTDPAAVRSAVLGADVVVNAAAWTNVDGAETDETGATAVNGYAVRNLADAAGKRLIQVSTDYVFDGAASAPYPEEAPPAPINAYGRGKAVGEQAVLAAGGYVVRTAWLYGEHGPNFVTTMAKLAAERDTVDVVSDQHGQPTWTADLAERIITLAGSGAPRGVYHGTNSGRTSWYGLAREIFTVLGLEPDRVRPTTSERFPRPARRPAWSVLGHDAWAAAGLSPMRDWRDALHAACDFLDLPGERA